MAGPRGIFHRFFLPPSLFVDQHCHYYEGGGGGGEGRGRDPPPPAVKSRANTYRYKLKGKGKCRRSSTIWSSEGLKICYVFILRQQGPRYESRRGAYIHL